MIKQLQAELDSWCGEKVARDSLPAECSQSVQDKLVSASECIGADCDYEYQCEDNNCESLALHVKTQFNNAAQSAAGESCLRALWDRPELDEIEKMALTS